MTTKTTKKLSSDELREFKKIACENDTKIVQALGFEYAGGSSIQQSCPIHGGDNPSAFSYHFGKCCWSCFTHQCHKKLGNDIIGLVRGVLGLSFQDAITWIQEIINSEKFEPFLVEREQPKIVNPVLSHDRLKKLDCKHPFIKSRGFTEEIACFFESGVSLFGKTYHHRLMVPIKNQNGDLVGITGRSIFAKNEHGWHYPKNYTISEEFRRLYVKWRNYPKGFNKSIEVYNIHNAKQSIMESGFAVVVEGPFDCWRMHSYGVKNVIAILGSSMSRRQGDILSNNGAKKLALMLDSDEAGIKASLRIKSMFNKEFDVSRILTEQKDPDSVSQEEFDSTIAPQIRAI